jgi:hypothetical protein
MREGFLHEEMCAQLVIYEEAVSHTVYDFPTALFKVSLILLIVYCRTANIQT